MFKKKNSNVQTNFIGSITEIHGNIKSVENLHIEGKVYGSVRTLGNITITETARIEGDIVGKDIVIEGYVEGNVLSCGLVELGTSGTISGSITAKSLKINEGSTFTGHCVVDREEDTEMKFSEESLDWCRPRKINKR